MMSLSSPLRTLAAVACLLSVLAACGSPPPTAVVTPLAPGDEPLLPASTASLSPADGDAPEATASAGTPPVQATSAPEKGGGSPSPTVTGSRDAGSEAAATLAAGNQNPPAGGQLPILVEVIQAPVGPGLPAPMPPADAAPGGVFAFDRTTRELLVRPSIAVLPGTEVLVGVWKGGVPGRPFVPGELYQLPSDENAPLTVLAIDAAAGALTLAYGDRTFDLRPGESLSFKQAPAGSLLALHVTVTNLGRPSSIGPLPEAPANP